MKTVPISNEERVILKSLEVEQLQFLSKLKDDVQFQTFKDIVNFLIDLEKDQFFGEDESKYSETVWQAKHAYARGGVGKLIMMLHVIYASGDELNRRQDKEPVGLRKEK